MTSSNRREPGTIPQDNGGKTLKGFQRSLRLSLLSWAQNFQALWMEKACFSGMPPISALCTLAECFLDAPSLVQQCRVHPCAVALEGASHTF